MEIKELNIRGVLREKNYSGKLECSEYYSQYSLTCVSGYTTIEDLTSD